MSSWQSWQPQGTPAESYERDLVPAIFSQWVLTLLDLVAIQPGDRVLDVGCGTGIVTRAVPARVGPSGVVVGQDASAGMLAVARQFAAAHGLTIEWTECDAAALPYPDAAFDVVVSQQALQFMADKVSALRQMHRVLASGGRLGLAVWRSTAFAPGWAALQAALARHVGDEAARLPPFALGDADILRALVEEAGFTQVEIRAESKLSRFASPQQFVQQAAAGAPTMLGALASVSETERQAVVDEVVAALEPYTSAEGLAFPQATHLISARA